MNSTARSRVGIVGVGEMGTPLVERLHAAGHQVSAFARRAEVRSHLAAIGVQVVDDVPSLGKGRDIVVVYVYSDSQVRQVVLDDGLIDSMEPGSLLMVTTTGSPATVQEIARRAGDRGVAVVDAPGSGSPAQVANGSLTVFAGGTSEDVERCRPLFDAYASTVHHVGPLGSGQMVKLINNLLFGCQIELAAEACRLAESAGIDHATLARTLATGSGQSYSLDLVGALGSVDRLLAAAGHFVHKDLLVAHQVAQDLGVSLGLFGAVLDATLQRTSAYIGSES